jgi:coproporphyrinogen III oxidase-like Fe-S oxidoreductase
MMIHEPISWLKKVEKTGNGLQNNNEIDDKELLDEIIMMALRTKIGLTREILANHQAFSNKSLTEIFDLKKLSYLIEKNFIELNQDKLRIKKDQFILANQIILKIIQSL